MASTEPETPPPTNSRIASGERNKLKRRFINTQSEEQIQKHKLQSELMQIKIYKHKLEVFKLEKELNLPASDFTKELRK